jgi:hypothetical protein
VQGFDMNLLVFGAFVATKSTAAGISPRTTKKAVSKSPSRRRATLAVKSPAGRSTL